MAGPYDYTINIPQPPAQNFLQSLLGIQQLKQMQEQGALQQRQMAFQEQMQPLQIQAEQARIGQIGASTAAAQEALRQGRITFEQAQTERALKTQYQNDVLQLSKSPETWTPEKLRSLSMQAAVLDPQTFGAMNKMFAELPRVGSTLSNAASEVMLSVQAGKPEIASSSLDKYISAANAALEKNPNDKAAEASLAFLTSAKTTVEQDPTAGALTASNFLFNTDPQKWDAVAKAMKGVGEIATESSKSELQQSQKRLAEADAKLKELKATGKLDAEEIIKQETARRENFISQPFVRNYPIRRDAYNIVTGAEKTPIGDSSKIVAFIKLQDPGSVVSVTEKGQITTTTPIASLQSLVSKFNNEGLLDSKTRRDIDSQAKNIFESAKYDFEQFKKRETTIAKRYGLNPENIVSAFDVEEKPQAEPVPPTVSPVAPGQPINTGTLPIAPAGGIFTIDGMEMRIVPRKK
jgi:hypothetical protein